MKKRGEDPLASRRKRDSWLPPIAEKRETAAFTKKSSKSRKIEGEKKKGATKSEDIGGCKKEFVKGKSQ